MMDATTDLAELMDYQGLVKRFLGIYKRDPGTLRTYETRFNRWKNFLNEHRGTSVIVADENDVKLYVEQLAAEGIMPHVQKQYVQAVRVLYDFMISEQIFTGENPVGVYVKGLDAFAKINARYDRTIERVAQKDKFSPEEMEKIMIEVGKQTCAPYLGIAIDVSINAGIRVAGIGKLTLDKFQKDEKGQFYIQLTKGIIRVDNDTKSHSYKAPVSESFVNRVREFVEARNVKLNTPNDTRVFVSTRGNTIGGNVISQYFTRFIRGFLPRDEIDKRKLSINSLRKNYGSRMLNEADFKLHEVSKLLGHSKLASTMHYLRMGEQEVLDAYAEKSKTQELDYVEKLKSQLETRKIQKSQEEIAAALQENDREFAEVEEMLLNGQGNQTHLEKREIELTQNRKELMSQTLTPREQELLEEREMLLNQIKSLEDQLAFASDKMKQLPNFKMFEKKTKRNLKTDMKLKANELRKQGLGYGMIAEKINEEFHVQFGRGTIKYWLDNSVPQ